jgi:site-specific recombinase XerD
MSAAPDVLQQLTEGVIVRPVLPCRRAVDRYLGDLLRLGKRPRTIDTYRRCLDDFTDTLPADWDIAKVTANEVRAFLDKYNRKSPAYRAQKDSILRAFFKWLYREELIRRSPMERMQPPKRQRDEDKDVLTVSSSDVRKLLAECRDWRERITLSVLAYMGPRRHAASQLRCRTMTVAG